MGRLKSAFTFQHLSTTVFSTEVIAKKALVNHRARNNWVFKAGLHKKVGGWWNIDAWQGV
jgi:hypothetical protein